MTRALRPRLSYIAGAATIVLSCFALSAAANQKKKLPPTPIDLNTASVEQLEQLPGIGPTTAHAIVTFRQKSGPFQRVEDLLAVRRISASKFEKLRPYITVGKTRSPANR